jgi:dTDP-N-acetylfucosamine:lipid II N-acetylfucosaminyltransferase
MNVHIFSDGLGFYAKETVDRIERLDSGNNYYVNLTTTSKYQHDKIVCFPFSKTNIQEKILSINNVQRIYFHFFSVFSVVIFKKIRQKVPDVKSIWVFWSAEFYNLPEFLPDLYGDFSSNYLPRKSFWNWAKTSGSIAKSRLQGRVLYNHKDYVNAIKQINYFACLLDNDYKNVIDYTHAKMKHIRFAYLSYEQIIDPAALTSKSNGLKILINHSADPALNHYEVLLHLKERGISNDLYMPLAYGDEKYRSDIISISKTWFGDQIEIQTNFLEKDAYISKLKEIGFAIFNIKVQQGIGNILLLLWLGVKVFFQKKNPVFIDFKSWGMHVYSIEEDLPEENFNAMLELERVNENRALLQSKLSNLMVDSYYLDILNKT